MLCSIVKSAVAASVNHQWGKNSEAAVKNSADTAVKFAVSIVVQCEEKPRRYHGDWSPKAAGTKCFSLGTSQETPFTMIHQRLFHAFSLFSHPELVYGTFFYSTLPREYTGTFSTRLIILKNYILIVLGLDSGYTFKYSPLPLGVPLGLALGKSRRWRLYLPYIPRLVLIRIKYTNVHYTLLQLSTVFTALLYIPPQKALHHSTVTCHSPADDSIMKHLSLAPTVNPKPALLDCPLLYTKFLLNISNMFNIHCSVLHCESLHCRYTE